IGHEPSLPGFWSQVGELGWLGLHIAEEHGGSGYGIEELAVVVEQMGRAVAPGPFVPTVIASAAIAAAGDDAIAKQLLPGLADGSTTAGVATRAAVELRGDALHGTATVVCGHYA